MSRKKKMSRTKPIVENPSTRMLDSMKNSVQDLPAVSDEPAIGLSKPL